MIDKQRVGAILSLLLAAGCGTEQQQPGGGAPPPPATEPPETPTPMEEEVMEDEPDPPPPPPVAAGTIQLVEMANPAMGMAMVAVAADFEAWREVTPVEGESPAECRVFLSGDADAGEPPPPPMDVGAITVQGGAMNLTLEFRDGAYDAAVPDGTTELFAPGDQLIALGAGLGEVGEFEVEVEAPVALQVVQPNMLRRVGPFSVSEDLVVEWQAGDGDFVQILMRSRSDQQAGAVLCIVLDTGAHTIPRALMAELPQGRAMFSVARAREGQGEGPGVQVSLLAGSMLMAMTSVGP